MEFFVTTDHLIYIHQPSKGIWECVSPNPMKLDYIIDDNHIKNYKGYHAHEQTIKPAILKMWHDYNPIWEYNRKQYTTVSADIEKFNELPTYNDTYHLIMYNGQFKWVNKKLEHYPKVDLIDIDDKDLPDCVKNMVISKDAAICKLNGNIINFAHIKYIKCIDDNKFI